MIFKSELFILSTILLILSISILSCSIGEKAKKIDDLMKYSHDAGIFNGVVLVAHNGKIIYKRALGYANFENPEKLKTSSVFSIGSISKQFTAMAIMILKEQKKLSYDDKLSDYFPEFPAYAENITIRNLLNHTSGIKNWMNYDVFRARPGDFKDDITNKDVFEFLAALDSLDFAPGEKYSYSNSGYLLLAMIVEKVSGEPFYRFMESNIFRPLGMENTLVWNDTKPEIPGKTTGYNQFGDIDDYNILTAGAGGIYSTVEDLYKWDQALYTEKLVSRQTLGEAFTPGLLSSGESSRTLSDSTWGYGFGWLLRKTDSENIVWHDGGFNGFNAIFYRELNNRDLIIFLTNKGEPWPLYPIHGAVINILKGEPYEFPLIPVALKMKEMIDKEGLSEAINLYDDLRKTHADKYDFSEKQLNTLGYYYINRHKFGRAKAILKLNIDIFPESANTYDSYAEACMLNGDYDEAIENYNRSLELDPDNSNAVEMLNELSERQR